MANRKKVSCDRRKSGRKSRNQQLALARGIKSALHALQEPIASTSSTVSQPMPSTSTSSTTESVQPDPLSASKRKMNFYADKVVDDASDINYILVDHKMLAGLISGLLCPKCQQPVSLNELSSSFKCGLAVKLSLVCSNCCYSKKSMSSPKTPNKQFFDINRRIVATFLSLGHGWADIDQFCGYMGMECISENSYAGHLFAVYQTFQEELQRHLDQSAIKVKEHFDAQQDSVLDIAVSFDGTWHKRGHTSRYGVGAVIESETGLVLDYQVMSSFCHACAVTGTEKRKHGEDIYNEWMAHHKPNCQRNHDGSAGAMEVESANILWSRSLNRGFRYTTIISDGDCKTFNDLCALGPYPGTPITKEECVNHVSKRLGTGLKNLVATESKRGKTLGGRKVGRLTQTKIALLQSYYKKAVMSKNATVEELKKRIWMSFNHASSTDANPHHEDCPDGALSWCFYKRAVALGKPIPSHSGTSSCFISPEVAASVRGVYERLTDDGLLKRCLKGMTQNANESLHSKIWRRCPKHLPASFRRVCIAAGLGVVEFNSGSAGLHQFFRSSLCAPNWKALASGKKRDIRRISRSFKKISSEAKRRRVIVTRAQIKSRSEQERKEGEVYKAGNF